MPKLHIHFFWFSCLITLKTFIFVSFRNHIDEGKVINASFYFIEAILKNKSVADAKKREQFAILKKQMELDLQVRLSVVAYVQSYVVCLTVLLTNT
jgi:hypothetical protein